MGAGVQDLSWKRPKLKFGLQQVPVKTKLTEYEYSVNILLTGAGVQDLSWKRPKLKFGLQQVPVKTKLTEY